MVHLIPPDNNAVCFVISVVRRIKCNTGSTGRKLFTSTCVSYVYEETTIGATWQVRVVAQEEKRWLV